MIIDDVGIHHGDWPLISINAIRDIKNSNWRDRNDVAGVRWDVDLGVSALIAAVGELWLEV